MHCRYCEAKVTVPVVSLGTSPLSNGFLRPEDLHRMEPYYPLEVFVCGQCFLVQLEEFELAKNIFNQDYAYFSSFSNLWLAHSKAYVHKMIPMLNLTRDSLVVEIASNDGYLLQYFVEKKIPVLGIEPTANTAEAARKKGVPTEVVFFNTETAKRLMKEKKQADLLLGNNVLAHVPNLNDFVAGLKIALKPAGTITMEFPHLEKLFEGNQFDTIYHEHFSYLSFIFVESCFKKHGLTIYDVEELPTHGGSLRIFATHVENKVRSPNPQVTLLKEREIKKGYHQIPLYTQFAAKAEKVKRDFLKFILDAKEKSKTVVAYGAAAKGNTLLNYCGIKPDLISYVVDKSPHKQNRFLPGSRLPVYAPEKIFETKPDYVVILPWNIKDEVISNNEKIREWGGQFVIPIPSVQVV